MASIQGMKSKINRTITGAPFETRMRWVYSSVYGFYKQDREYLYEKQALRVLKKVLVKDSNCVDVGAFEGAYLRNVIKLAPSGIHYAFEPIPMLYRKLVGRFPRAKVFNCALSDRVGESSFKFVVNHPGYSGFIERKYDFEEPIIQEIKVKTDTLDNIYPSIPLRLLKIDVEGAEYQVMVGGLNTIRNNKPIVLFEHGLGAADRYGTRPECLYDLLVTRCGMQINLLINWLGGDDSLSRAEFVEEFVQAKNYYFIAYP